MLVASLLPVSGTHVWLREPTGGDELVVLESSGPPLPTILALAERLATDVSGAPVDWPALPAVDLAAATLLIRATWLGETIRTEAMCAAANCSEPIDISFAISDYLEHHRPRRHRGVADAGDGWYALAGSEVRFRVPTVADVLAKAPLLERCVSTVELSPAEARRVDRALEALAPRLDGELTGTCPECSSSVDLRFDPIAYVLEELRDALGGLLAQVHELARAYHWSEREILELERRRRHAYVALAREEFAFA